MATIDTPIDPQDRRLILILNDHAASFRALADVARSPARDVYLVGLGRFLAYTDCAVDRAVERAMCRVDSIRT